MLPARKSDWFARTGTRFARNTLSAVVIVVLAFIAIAQSGENPSSERDLKDATSAKLSTKAEGAPRRHIKLQNSINLSNQEAEAIYAKLKAKMAKAYAMSGIGAAQNYQKWQRYNTVPFVSAAHGRRLVNTYANSNAQAYGNFEKAGILPVGSIVAKDNITVTKDGKTLPGALLMMEKMPADFNYVSGDWRYTMILPDGSIFGTTNGDGSANVEFCIACHLAAEKHDHLHFMPPEFRKQ